MVRIRLLVKSAGVVGDFKNMNTEPFKVTPATRRGITPLLGLYGGPGVGKTLGGLLIARGMAGPAGEVCLIDTESRRGSFYADEIPGSYKTIDFEPPFSPPRYMEAIRTAVAQGAKVVVVDSFSHCWEGEGGVCDQAAENEASSGKSGLHNWKRPKTDHRLMVAFLMRAPVPIICCMRAKQKTKTGKDEKTGKQVIRKDDYYTPIQEADFAFELTTAIEIQPDHSLIFTKKSLQSLCDCFPQGAPITIKHGELIAKWCAAGGQPVAQSNPMEAELKAVKTKIWNATKAHHGGDMGKLEAWLQGLGFIGDTDRLADMSLDGLHELLATISTALNK
jgi:hypothetical protein